MVKTIIKFALGIVVVMSLLTANVAFGARTDSTWQRISTHLETTCYGGCGLLLEGLNKFVNFGSTYGESGYGLRDNSGTMEFKNSGGSWTEFGTGTGTSTGLIELNGLTADPQYFATSSSDNVSIDIVSSGDTHTFTTSILSGYIIPLIASTTEWATSFGWGDHSSVGYLTSYTETDPIFTGHEANNITTASTTNWINAFGWGDHSLIGYITSYTESDPIWIASSTDYDTSTEVDTKLALQDECSEIIGCVVGAITSYTESDPIWIASSTNYYTKAESDIADDDTTYTATGTLLYLTGTEFSVNEGTLTDTKYCTYETGVGLVCNSEGGGGDETDPIWVASSTNWLSKVEWNATTTDALTQGSTNLYNQTHTSEVTGSVALTIASDIVDEDNLKVANTPTNDYVLTASSTATGGLVWGSPAGGGTVTSVAQTVPLGWTVTGSPITGAGTLALDYDAGYEAILTASTTNWNGFYDTPSTRITAGTNLSWAGNTLNATAGSGAWTDLGSVVETTDGESARASYFTATSTTATSTFAGYMAVGGTYANAQINGNSVDARIGVWNDNPATVWTSEIGLGRVDNTNAVAGATIYGGRSRGTFDTQTVVQNGDNLFDIVALGHDGTDFAISSRIDMEADGVPSNDGVEGRIVFKTSADGSQDPTEAMRITSGQYVGIGTTAPSTMLDVYGTSTTLFADVKNGVTLMGEYITNFTSYVRGLFSETVTGLTYNSSTGVTSLDAGYSILLATSTTNLQTVWSYGDHNLAGYLTSYSETDPVFIAHEAYNITSASTTNWESAYGWGDHDLVGYLTSYTETDPIWIASSTNYDTSSEVDAKLALQDECSEITGCVTGALTTESDPIWVASSTNYYTKTESDANYDALGQATSTMDAHTTTYNHPNYDLAFGWGDWNGNVDISTDTNLTVGATGIELALDDIALTTGYEIPLSASTSEWSTAYSWGDHDLVGYLTSYTETDPVWIASSTNYDTSSEVDSKLALQDECSEITGCVVGAITGNETITLSGDITGAGTTAITTAIATGVIVESDLDVNTPVNGYALLASSTATGGFAWGSVSAGGDTWATIQSAGTGVSTNAPTLDFDADFTLTETPTDDFDITITDDTLDYSHFSNIMTIDQDTTLNLNTGQLGYVWDIADTGTTGNDKGGWHVDNSDNTGHAMTLLSTLGATANGPLVRWEASSSTFDKPVLEITNEGTAGSASAIRINGPRPEIEFWDTDLISPEGGFEILNNGDRFNISGRNVGDTGFEPIMEFYRVADGGDVNLLDSGSAYQINTVDVLTGTTLGSGIVNSSLTSLGVLTALTSTGVIDFGGATSFEIPNGTAPTVDATGEMALDTTKDQLVIADSSGTARVYGQATTTLGMSSTFASTSAQYIDSLLLVPQAHYGFTVTAIWCYVEGGTSVDINITDGTNDTNTVTCDTTKENTSPTGVFTTNNIFTVGETRDIELSSKTGTINHLVFNIVGHITVE